MSEVVILLLLSAAIPLAVLIVLAVHRAPPVQPQEAPEQQVVYRVIVSLTDAQIEARCWRVEGVLAAHKSQCKYATTDGRRWLLSGPNADRDANELRDEIRLSIGDQFVEVRG